MSERMTARKRQALEMRSRIQSAALRAGGARVRLYVAPRDELSPAYETERTPCRR